MRTDKIIDRVVEATFQPAETPFVQPDFIGEMQRGERVLTDSDNEERRASGDYPLKFLKFNAKGFLQSLAREMKPNKKLWVREINGNEMKLSLLYGNWRFDYSVTAGYSQRTGFTLYASPDRGGGKAAFWTPGELYGMDKLAQDVMADLVKFVNSQGYKE